MTFTAPVVQLGTNLRRCDTNVTRAFLVAVVFLALVPRLVLGLDQFIHYDGYWHVFTASQNRWQLFLSEWRGDAHPIVFYLLLRAVSTVSHSHLAYRSLSIVPNLASVYLLGVVAKATLRNMWLAPLAAAAFGLSMTMIDIACDVRGYALALMFVIWAYSAFLSLLERTEKKEVGNALVLFGVLSSLAIATEYYSLFFTVSCLATVLLLAATHRAFRMRLSGMWRDVTYQAGAAILLPLFTFLWLYATHLRFQPHVESNVIEFYWNQHVPIFKFLANGLTNDINAMSPIEIKSPLALVTLFIVWLSAVLSAAFKPVQKDRELASTAAGLILLFLAGELMILGLARRYPFGGFARQQSILFPFFVLSTFTVLDRAFTSVLPKHLVAWAGIALAALILWNFDLNWNKFPKVKAELFTSEFALFESSLHNPPVVYVDQFSLIAYYIHTHDSKWKFRHHFVGLQRVDQYDLSFRSGQRVKLLRNLDSWNFDLMNPEFYTVLADLVLKSQTASVTLFFVKQGNQSVSHEVEAQRLRRITDLAEHCGLTVKQAVLTQEDVFATFALK